MPPSEQPIESIIFRDLAPAPAINLSEFVITESDIESDPEYDIGDFIDAEFTDYERNEPFLYSNRWYAVMGDEENLSYPYEVGTLWFSRIENCEFRLRRRVDSTLFGSQNSFSIMWHEEINEENSEPMDDGYSVEREEIDIREDIAPVLSTNIGREVPLISIEQEFSGNGDLVARILHDMGIAYSRYSDGYHMSEARNNHENERICYVETDSSCGYELIFSKVNLKNRSEAEKISEVQKVLRKLKNQEAIRLSARCGFHIHVDVSDWGMKEIVSAYHLWNYMEDTVFRFASAFWGSHRDEEVGGAYSIPVPKGYTGRAEIANTIMDRRDALNFTHILRAKSNCRCGASIYEDWANCTCNLAQPTLEFRVFNATINQRKIRAYLAFCIAFVNMAKEYDHTPDKFPEMRWRGTNVRDRYDFTEPWEEATEKRLKYILQEFPLTNSEKSDIIYCLRNSSVESVLEFL